MDNASGNVCGTVYEELHGNRQYDDGHYFRDYMQTFLAQHASYPV
jgi:hypothetical protein